MELLAVKNLVVVVTHKQMYLTLSESICCDLIHNLTLPRFMFQSYVSFVVRNISCLTGGIFFTIPSPALLQSCMV